ncbi:hypothetical protein E2C01_097760 [Portunus trituberculatus]|uniref:Uncharacterized protein n=1 Tax=Portunus trituberculatus TaxID=210409 RepID=A0A5B7KC82_PORTR|nr:hypothetical protein [Portunus trituberculatus]
MDTPSTHLPKNVTPPPEHTLPILMTSSPLTPDSPPHHSFSLLFLTSSLFPISSPLDTPTSLSPPRALRPSRAGQGADESHTTPLLLMCTVAFVPDPTSRRRRRRRMWRRRRRRRTKNMNKDT